MDSLAHLIDMRFASADLREHDSICNAFDGDLTEHIGSVSVILFEKNLNDFIVYLQLNVNSCLKGSLIETFGSELSVYDKNDKS